MWLITEFFLLILKMTGCVLESMYRLIFPGPPKDISGQTVLITGAGRGLGRLLAVEFAKLGARLVLWDINTELNEETASMVKALGKEAFPYKCDCCSREQIYSVAEQVKRDVGNVDILINNAGILNGKRLLDFTDEQIQKTIELNLLAHFWTTRSFLPYMMEHNNGHIVTISSVAGSFPTAYQVEYCASKYGAVGFHEALTLELHTLGRDGIKTTLIQPFFFDTGISWYPKMRFPMLSPLLKPSYVADQVISAVLRNQCSLFITRDFAITLVVKSLLPTKAYLLLNDFLGIGIDEHYSRDSTKKME